MRLDHLLSREILIQNQGFTDSDSQIQHPAPGAPAPRHLDSRIAKHGFRRYAGPGKPSRPPRTNNEINSYQVDSDSSRSQIIQDLLDVVYLTHNRKHFRTKIQRARGGCLGAGSRRRARQAAISRGEAQTAFDPRIPEWGNPAGAMPCYRPLNQIGGQEATGGTETSKYPEEEKSTEIPGVAASETGPAQTGARASVRAFPRRCCWAGQPRSAYLGRCYKPAI